MKKVANEVFVVEYFPYHTEKFSHKMHVPSQAYSQHLVKEALKRNALIILMRGRAYWHAAIPELAEYTRYHELNSNQNTTISPNNCPNCFPEIRRIFESKYGPLAQ